jgi:hypothetical protein
MAVDFEERQLLPLLVDVHNAFSSAPIAPVMGFRFTPGQRPAFDDVDAMQRRLQLDVDLGVISKERYAVMMGHYKTEDEARSAIDAMQLSGVAEIGATAAGPSDASPAVSPAGQAPDLNQLTLGIERLTRAGDAKLAGKLKAALTGLLNG